MRVLVSYQGYQPEIEEELYFVSRTRPTQAGEQIVQPVPAERQPGLTHYPEERQQQHRMLTYHTGSIDEAFALGDKLATVEGVKVSYPDFHAPEPLPNAVDELPQEQEAAAVIPVDELSKEAAVIPAAGDGPNGAD